MAITMTCGACGKLFKVLHPQAGKVVSCPRCSALVRVRDPSQEARVDYVRAAPSWFLPIVMWFFVASVGVMAGFVYGKWFREPEAPRPPEKALVIPDRNVGRR